MSLINIITNFATDIGADVVENRAALITLANRAALEIYDSSDLPGSLMEIVASVNQDRLISLPSYMRNIRAIREYYAFDKINLVDMRPRYNYEAWNQIWNKWRLRSNSPIKVDITNASVIKIYAGAIEINSPVISIIGSTTNSNKLLEQIVLSISDSHYDAVNNCWVTINAWTSIACIVKNITNTYNIIIRDINDIELAIIDNDKLSSSYIIVDVSALPTTVQSNTGSMYVEILYKRQFDSFINDADEVLNNQFDNAIIAKMAEIWTTTHPGEEKRALLHYQKSNQLANQKIVDVSGPTQKEFTAEPVVGYMMSQRFPFNER